MANVTYLLGAGASYNALPIVDEISTSINLTVRIIRELLTSEIAYDRDYRSITIKNEKKYQKILEQCEHDLLRLNTGCRRHLSIDTYLKMLFLTKSKNYQHAKAVMVLFFCLHECLFDYIQKVIEVYKKEIVDKRYDAFFASILQESFDNIPDNIKIISWNYDNQIELAYNNYILNSKSELNTDDLLNIYHKNEDNTNFQTDKFGIYNINGTASYFDKNNVLIKQIKKNDLSTNDKLKIVLDEYYDFLNGRNSPAISFAWDSIENTKQLISKIKEAVKKTEILVIIGYSMPFFNRDIDKEILSRASMRNIEKVYIQDKNPQDVIDRLKGIRPDLIRKHTGQPIEIKDNITSITNLKQFHLPNEL